MRDLRNALIVVLGCSLALGLAYPLAMTGAAQAVFPHKADGEAKLIGRDFSKDRGAFQSRPSATGYAADATFFNNLGPNQKALAKQLRKAMRAYLRRERPYTPGLTAAQVPPDAVTTSASGVDPDISVANALIQANRVARAHGMSRARVVALIRAHERHPDAVNVAELNEALR